MPQHTTALVPIETWAYQSPELRAVGKQVDVGLLAESLIYYETVLLNLANQPQLAELLVWLRDQRALDDFLSLARDGVIRIYDYAFASAPVLKEGRYILLNIQDQLQAEPNSFDQRFLYHASVTAVLPHARSRERLYRSLRDRVIEVKADEFFGAAIENARADCLQPKRVALIVQHLVDEVYAMRGLRERPSVVARVEATQGAHTIHFNVDFDDLGRLAGGPLNLTAATPVAGSIHTTRLLWSAASLNCDLFLPSPVAMLVGDKLYEADAAVRTHTVVDRLQATVEFPDIRRLVNAGTLPFSEVLRIRRKASRFRKWLQDEADRDRDALIAYHHEVAKEAGLVQLGRRVLNLAGVIGGGAVSGVGGALAADLSVAAVAGAAGSAVGYLLDLGSRIGADWRPVVFGNWMKERIAKVLEQGRG